MSDVSKWFLYIVKCADGTLYTGISVDVEKRVKKHNSGLGAKSLKFKKKTPVELVYTEKHLNRSEASKRELEIKRWTRVRKLKLIETGMS